MQSPVRMYNNYYRFMFQAHKHLACKTITTNNSSLMELIGFIEQV